MRIRSRWSMMVPAVAAIAVLAGGTGSVLAQEQSGGGAKAPKPDFPPFAEVAKDFEKVVSTTDGSEPLYGLWIREKDGQMLLELPRGYQNQKYLIAMTVPTGELFAGLQAGDRYVYWKRFDKRMMLIEPNVATRSTGDAESKDSIKNHFTDRVLIDVPIVCMGPNGQPVIDADALFAGSAGSFYGGLAGGANARLAMFQKDRQKTFPQNTEVEFTMPTAGGVLKTFHYSIRLIPDNTGYQPRKADERVGYFTTSFRDLGKFKDDEVWTRYINRWHLEKKEPKLKMSPPKEPIVFYVEHTVPARYRRWIKEGVEYWNEAFEKVGLVDAVVVYYQDKETGAHMDKDPEDARYNFIRWLSNDIGTAVGPSRAHPLTGQILDADIVLTDGWIRHFWYQANEFMPQAAMEGFSEETLAWLDKNPQWDPRVRLAPPEDRPRILAERAQRIARGEPPITDAAMMGNTELQRLAKYIGIENGLCLASHGKARDMALMGMSLEVMGLLDEPEGGEGEKDEADRLDGIPEWFVGPMLADLTCHEVGHTLGLRHNFKASSIYSLKEINSPEFKGQKPFAGSVMDYIPVNINMGDGDVQGDYTMIGVGPYDMWAIEYGYTFGDTKDVLKRVSQPELAYSTDDDTGGPDPLARRYDFSADPRDYAASRMKLVNEARTRILDKFVKDGESWSKARRGYQITLSTQTDAVSIMANWLGGSFVVRDKKGDAGGRTPVTPVPADQQRAALQFVIDNTFRDEAFGLTPELLGRMTVDKWGRWEGGSGGEPTWPVHDRIMGMQASTMTMLMNPSTLRRVYDNEFVVPSGQDALTLPELMDTISAAVWTELDATPDKKYTAREPMISSLRRNLQREHMERLIDLSMEPGINAASKPIANLATMKLRQISDRVARLLEKADSNIDPYSLAHLTETKMRIDKALDAIYVYNNNSGGGLPAGYLMLFGEDGRPVPAAEQPADGN